MTDDRKQRTDEDPDNAANYTDYSICLLSSDLCPLNTEH